MSSIISWISDIGMAIGPVLGYVYQYRLIKLNQQVGSFSIDICGILIFANVLRLNFYMFKQFQTALIYQSLFMIIMQILLLQICAKFNPKKIQINMTSDINQNEYSTIFAQYTGQSNLQDGNPQTIQMDNFWRWQKFRPFAVTIFVFIGGSFTVSGIFYLLDFWVYGELIGLVSLIAESMLILPQIIKNIRMGTTRGLSKMLLFLNLCGDILKLIYFLLKSQPFQFILCGCIQTVLDSFVIGQIFYYRSKQKSQKKSKNKILTPVKRNRWVHEQFQEEIDYQDHKFDDDQSAADIRINPRRLQLKINRKELDQESYQGKYLAELPEESFTSQYFVGENQGTELQCDQNLSKSDTSSPNNNSSPINTPLKDIQPQIQKNMQQIQLQIQKSPYKHSDLDLAVRATMDEITKNIENMNTYDDANLEVQQ